MRAVLGIAGLLCSLGVMAQDASPSAAVSTATATELSGQLIQLLLGLLLVIGVIFLLAWLVRRIQHNLPVSKSNQAIRLIATQPLGTRERLLLVQVGKEQILLGITPGAIEPLHVLKEPIEVPEHEGSGQIFGSKLKTLLKAQNIQEKKEES